MSTIYQLKPKFQALLTPTMHRLHRMGATPNHLTVLALLASIGVGAWIFFVPNVWGWAVVPGFLFIRMALNALDGLMARTYSLQSKTGEVLNEIGDVISDAVLYYPLLLTMGMDRYPHWLVLFMATIGLNEMAGIMGKVIGGERRYDGPMGKSDRALVFGLLCLVVLIFPSVLEFVFYLLLLVIIGMLYGTYRRIHKSLVQ
ncbi:MAG: CDP-alcohol phosphatidyltransferase family protein [Flavobacteriales bacterium]